MIGHYNGEWKFLRSWHGRRKPDGLAVDVKLLGRSQDDSAASQYEICWKSSAALSKVRDDPSTMRVTTSITAGSRLVARRSAHGESA